MTSPSALRRPLGHFVIFTTTLLPVLAPLKNFLATKISCVSLVLSGVTKPKVLLRSNVPTIFSLARSKIRIISPSRERPSSCAGVTRATTRSPCIAVPIAPAGTKTSVSSSVSRTSGMIKPKPLAVIAIRPTTRCIRLGTPYKSLRFLIMAPSFSSSSRATGKSTSSSSVKPIASPKSSSVSGLYALSRI